METADFQANLLGAVAVGITDRMAEAIAERMGLDPSAAAALLAIEERSGRPVEHLRVTVGLTHSGAVRLATRLEQSGLIRRAPGQDRRTQALGLTGSGRRVAVQLREVRQQVLREVLASCGLNSEEELTIRLTQLLAALPQSQADAWRICRFCDHTSCRLPACPVGSAVQ